MKLENIEKTYMNTACYDIVHVELSQIIMPWALNVHENFILDSGTEFNAESKFLGAKMIFIHLHRFLGVRKISVRY